MSDIKSQIKQFMKRFDNRINSDSNVDHNLQSICYAVLADFWGQSVLTSGSPRYVKILIKTESETANIVLDSPVSSNTLKLGLPPVECKELLEKVPKMLENFDRFHFSFDPKSDENTLYILFC